MDDEINLFKDREDPTVVYVILKNKLQDGLLKDFHLSTAIGLATRLYNALPDKYLNARHYVDEVRKVLQTKVGDHTFSRKMGLNITSMLLGIDHQRRFDCLMARIEDSPLLKEPFDREIRGKMVSYQKQALDGLEKFQPLGALSKKNTELLGMYTTNKIPVPSHQRRLGDSQPERKRRQPSDRRQEKGHRSGPNQQRRPRREQRDQPRDQTRQPRPAADSGKPKVEAVESKPRSKGEKKSQISKMSRRDLQQIITIAVSNMFFISQKHIFFVPKWN